MSKAIGQVSRYPRPEVSKICFGCEPLGGTDWGAIDVSEIADAVDRAIELGVNFFDTAAVYGLGLSETRLSQILGGRRHSVVIATKGGLSWQPSVTGGRVDISKDSSPEYLRRGVEASLLRLRLDRLPVYFVHWPDPNTDIRSTFECLNELQNAGKIGLIGCSNFSADQVRLASQVAEISYVQIPLNILDGCMDLGMQQVVCEKNIGVVAYNVLASGLLTGKYGPDARFAKTDRRSRLPLFQGDTYLRALDWVHEISTVAEKEGLTCAQHSIAGVFERFDVTSAVLGVKTREQVEENCLWPIRQGKVG